MTTPAELGAVLKAARDEQKLTLSDLSVATGLPEKYLSALERGAHEDLPGRAYARLYFLNYARALNLNTDDLMLSWPQPGTGTAARAMARAGSTPRQSALWIAALLVVVGGWVAWHYFGIPSPADPARSAPPPSGFVTADSPAGESADSPVGVEATGAEVPGGAPSRPGAIARDPAAPVDTANAPQPVIHQLRLAARGETWIMVLADGDTAVARRFAAGDTEDVSARREFVLTVMLPGQVTATLDDDSLTLPPGGTRGLIWHRISLNPAETGT
jgi:transcriptional regulator with XRE-family HTH domain